MCYQCPLLMFHVFWPLQRLFLGFLLVTFPRENGSPTTRKNEVSNYRLALEPKSLGLCLTCSRETSFKKKQLKISSNVLFFFFKSIWQSVNIMG